MTAAGSAAAEAAGAIPRDYNFAADVLQSNLQAGRAGKLAYDDGKRRLTYGELADRVARFGAALRGLGLRREERVLMAMLDTVDWPTAFLGCLKAGIIAVPVNTLLTEDDYRFMLADSRAKCLVVSEALFPKFEKLIKQSPDLEHVIVAGDNPQNLDAKGYRLFEDLIASDEPEDYTAPTVADDIAFWLYTSGSTGKPKGRGACACQPETDRRSLRHAGRRPQGKRRRLFGGEIVLRLRARQRHDLPAHGRRHRPCSIRSGRRRMGSRRCSKSTRSRCSSRCRPSMPRSSTARTRRKRAT